MSLVVLFVIEFFGWVAFNRITPFSIPRTAVALGVTSASALIMISYASVYEPPLIDMMNLWTFGYINAILALGIAFTSFTRESSRT